MPLSFNRRSFIRNSAMTGLAVSVLPSAHAKPQVDTKKSVVRLGMIAVGLRGQSHLEEMLKRSDVEITAMADPDKKMMADAQKLVASYKRKAPVEYTNGNQKNKIR